MGRSSYRGIQTIRNWPGCPPRSARKRYVIVVGVSRTISRRGTTWIVGMGDPDRLRYGVEARFLQENAHFLYDFVEDAEAPREDRGSDLDRARTGHDVLQGVATRSDPTDADHGDMDLLADVVHGSHSDRPDRGAAKAAVLVRQRRHLQFWRDRHCLQCVDRDNPVGPAFLGGHGESGDVLDVRRELGKDGNVDDILHRAGEVPDRGRVLGDLGPEAPRVRAGQVQLDCLYAVRGHLRRDGRVLLGVLAEHGADHDRTRGVRLLDLVLVLDDARVRKADRVQQTGIQLDNRRVRIPLPRLRSYTLRHDRAGARLVDAGHGPSGFVEKPRGEHRWVSKPHPGDLGPEVHHRADRIDRGPKGFGWRNHPELTQRKRLGSRSCLAHVRAVTGWRQRGSRDVQIEPSVFRRHAYVGTACYLVSWRGEVEAVGPLWDRFV